MKYRSRPTDVDAIQWTGGDHQYLVDSPAPVRMRDGELQLLAGVDGAQGWVHVPVGHYVVWNESDDFSDFWPVEAEYFESKYIPVRTP